jgi:hypothetical protein
MNRARAHHLIEQAPQGAVSIKLLNVLLRLDHDTGHLFWRERPEDLFDAPENRRKAAHGRWNARYANRMAFLADDGHGYFKGTIFNKTYKAHRVVFALAHGRWPVDEIDHIDGDPKNNAPSNLRECNRVGNVRNAKAKRRSHKSSRYKGVTYRAKSGRWIVQCKGVGPNAYRGSYPTEIEAARAYDEIAREIHGEFARVNFP